MIVYKYQNLQTNPQGFQLFKFMKLFSSIFNVEPKDEQFSIKESHSSKRGINSMKNHGLIHWFLMVCQPV